MNHRQSLVRGFATSAAGEKLFDKILVCLKTTIGTQHD